jgi:hypothetical protein
MTTNEVDVPAQPPEVEVPAKASEVDVPTRRFEVDAKRSGLIGTGAAALAAVAVLMAIRARRHARARKMQRVQRACALMAARLGLVGAPLVRPFRDYPDLSAELGTSLTIAALRALQRTRSSRGRWPGNMPAGAGGSLRRP